MKHLPRLAAKLAMPRGTVIATICLLTFTTVASGATYQQIHAFAGGSGTFGPGGKPLLIGSTIYGSYGQELFGVHSTRMVPASRSCMNSPAPMAAIRLPWP